jgi:hypothetical protein
VKWLQPAQSYFKIIPPCHIRQLLSPVKRGGLIFRANRYTCGISIAAKSASAGPDRMSAAF